MDLITPINDLIHEEPGSLCILTGLKLGKPKKKGLPGDSKCPFWDG